MYTYTESDDFMSFTSTYGARFPLNDPGVMNKL